METLTLDGVSVGSLRAVSFAVAPGEIVCLSGASGSGKSRLLRAIADLDEHQGDVTIADDRQSAVAAHCWRGWVMLVPAETTWWGERVEEHFLEPVPGSLEAFGFPEDVLSWEITRLSSGEKQRLAILRALSHQPRALLLDEPTANLDGETTRRVERWLCEYIRRQGLPVIWVAHDPAQIERIADRHFVIRGERLEESRCKAA